MDREVRLEAPGVGLHLLTGPNGSGKSTLARELAQRVTGARLLSAESQQAFYEALLANDESNFQQGQDTSTTVGELLGPAGREHPLLTAFRLSALWDRGYRLLSTGEGRKLLLLRALLDEPSLLVLDDPFDGLDVAARAELARAIAEVARTHPVLLVGAFEATGLPLALEAIREVREVAHGQIAFCGSAEVWRARARSGGGHTALHRSTWAASSRRSIRRSRSCSSSTAACATGSRWCSSSWTSASGLVSTP